LIKNIYEQLTPEQFYVLSIVDHQTYPRESKEIWGRLKKKLHHQWEHGREKGNIRNEILKDIVIKMINDISTK
jgi:hypothetical protein